MIEVDGFTFNSAIVPFHISVGGYDPMKKRYTLGCIVVTISMLIGTVGLGPLFIPTQASEEASSLSRGTSTVTWSDDFLDASKIDTNLSYNYTLSAGIVSMDNTYPAWVAYPDWKRMRPLQVTNSGSSVTNCILPITVTYDADMQLDFDDLRFTDSQGTPLLYHLVKKTNGVSADIFLKIPQLSSGQTLLYIFYGNPSASSGSSNVFTWTKGSADDVRISYVGAEGTWDPDISFGTTRFLAAWEEGVPPEYVPDQSHRLLPRHVHGRLYDVNGQNPSPPPETGDVLISTEQATYHCENPSIAFSPLSGYYFVTWEENPTSARYAVGIEGTFVRQSDGFVYTPTVIDDPEYQLLQYYPAWKPCVSYDDLSDRFLVVWEKSDTSWNWNVWGRLYTYNGAPVGSAFTIATGTGYQGQPWVSSDSNGHFLVVYEDGPSGDVGPISVKSILLNSNGSPVGSVQTLASGSSNTDYIFPSVTFNPVTTTYLAVWNTGDISSQVYMGNIDGRLIDVNGGLVGSMVTIESSTSCRIATDVSYLGTLFFVTYDKNADGIWGRLISSNAVLLENEFYLCDSLSDGADFSEMAVSSNGKIFSIWEDERYSTTNIFGTTWLCDQTLLYTNVGYSFGDEETRILDAAIMSVPISFENFVQWQQFTGVYQIAGGTLIFDVMNQSGTRIVKSGISSGEDLSLITEPVIRLRALFHRSTPQYTSTLDNWTVTALVGGDLEPPFTSLSMIPASPDGLNGWYVSPINVTLVAHDNDTAPENVTTYYRLNDGDVHVYTDSFEINEEQADNRLEYWSVDSAQNEELPHKICENLNIDRTSPFVTLLKPGDLIYPGNVTINGTATEYSSGSGIARLTVRVNGEDVFDKTYNAVTTIWFEYVFSAEIGESYEIHVEVYDTAGNKGEDHISTVCSERGIYLPGYLYLFDNPKIGPKPLLVTLGLSIALDYTTLYIVLPEYPANTSYVKFVATQVFMGNTKTVTDNDVSDGCSYELQLPLGVYEITAFPYDSQGQQLGFVTLISKLLVILLPSSSLHHTL